MTATPSSRPTVKQVNKDLNDLSLVVEDLAQHVERQLADAATSFAGLRKLTDDHRQGLQRSSTERKMLDRRLTKAENNLGELYAHLGLLKKRLQTLGEHAPDGILTATREELVRLDSQAKAYAENTQNEIDALRDDLDNLKSRVELVADSATNAHDRIDDVETDLKEFKESASLTVTQRSSMLPLVMGLIAGVVTFFVASAQDDVSTWRAVGFAVAIGAIAAGILSFFVSQIVKISQKRKSSTSTTSGKTAEADTSNTRSSASDDRTQVTSAPDQTEHTPDLAPAGSRTER